MREKESKRLTIVQGGRISSKEFLALPFAEKSRILAGRPSKQKLGLILDDPEGKRLVRGMQPFELYMLIKDIGDDDAKELIHYASPEQFTFILDLEPWRKWSFSSDKALHWLNILMEGDEGVVTEFVHNTDPDLLTLLFIREIAVGGGVGELASTDERLEDWDHSFDQLYFITFRNQKHSRIVGTLLDIIHRQCHNLYLTLMERIKSETAAEVEDLCFQLRSGRLADLGFPEIGEALALYSFCNPETVVLEGGKARNSSKLLPDVIPLPLLDGDTLVHRVIARQETPALLAELTYLINSALMADEPDYSSRSSVEAVFQRVYGYLNIALGYLCEQNEEKATAIVQDEYLKALFRLGFSLVLQLQRRSAKLTAEDYARGKVLAGLKLKRPRYYRGLDPDHIDGYREFRTIDDVRHTAELLEMLEQVQA
jgi:hypothetical protein